MAYISVISKSSGVPIKTIRFYEDIGLMPKPKRTSAQHRVYDDDTIDRLRFIKQAQSLGLRLEDIKEILELADRGRCPCGHVQHLLTKRLSELREKLIGLKALERRLNEATRRGCPPKFRPKGKAVCPTIQRQKLSITHLRIGGKRNGKTKG